MAAAGRRPQITWYVKMEAYLFDAFDTNKAARAQQRSGPSALRQKDLSTSAVFALKARSGRAKTPRLIPHFNGSFGKEGSKRS